MFQHKIIKIGNSVGITLPKKFLEAAELQIGDKLSVEFNREYKTLILKPKNLTYSTFLSAEYFKWLKKTHQELKPSFGR